MKNLKLVNLLEYKQTPLKSLLLGAWYGQSPYASASAIVLRFNEDGTFETEGSFYVSEKTAVCLNTKKSFVIDASVTFNGKGEYSVSEKNTKNVIKMTGNIDVRQKILLTDKTKYYLTVKLNNIRGVFYENFKMAD
jgi:hypothetical protein